MATKIVYHTPIDDNGKRARHEAGPNKGKEKQVERHELPIIDAADAVRRFPSQWSYTPPEGTDDSDIADRRQPAVVFTEEGFGPNGDPGDPAILTAPKIDPVDRPTVMPGGGPSQRESEKKARENDRDRRNDLG